MSEATPTPVCAECGFGLYSPEHMGGRGLHGHIRTSDEEANTQRADIMARAYAVADEATEAAIEGVVTAKGRAKKGN